MGTRLSRLIVIIQNKNHESEARLLKNTIARTAYELAAVLLKACARLRPRPLHIILPRRICHDSVLKHTLTNVSFCDYYLAQKLALISL